MHQAALNFLVIPPNLAAPLRVRQLRWARATLYGGVSGGTLSVRHWRPHRNEMALQSKYPMTEASDRTDAGQGIEGALLANRDRILRFLVVRGAGDLAEDIFQDLWMRLTERHAGPVADPLSYVMRAANNLMLDRYRSRRQSELRERAWGESAAVPGPLADRALISREQLAMAERAIAAAGDRAAQAFRRFRFDGLTQRQIAAEMGVSLSTVEADLRKVYAALAAVRRQFDA